MERKRHERQFCFLKKTLFDSIIFISKCKTLQIPKEIGQEQEHEREQEQEQD